MLFSMSYRQAARLQEHLENDHGVRMRPALLSERSMSTAHAKLHSQPDENYHLSVDYSYVGQWGEGLPVNEEAATAGRGSVEQETVRELLSPQQFADYLGLPVRTVYAWQHKGTSPDYIKVGKHVRYRRQDIESWLESNVVSGNRQA